MEKKILKSMESIPMMSESDFDCLILNDDQADEIYGGKENGYVEESIITV